MSFFENTRKPVGFGGKLMVAMMNLGHGPVARWGASISTACAKRQGAGLRLRRRGEHKTAAGKMPAWRRQGHRLFARQRGEGQEAQPKCNSGGALRRSARQRGGYGV